ncbi:MAG: methyltransferase domain-containing protein, partial [Gammaproteobacteria bacterium]
MSHSLALQQLKKHVQRWRIIADKSIFLTQEIGNRLLERLDLIKLQPNTILDISNIYCHQANALLRRYQDATVVVSNINKDILVNPTSLWQRWQRHEKNMVADFHQLPLADESIDFIFSNSLLYYSWDLPALIHEWFRVLKPGGLLLFSSLGPDTLKELRIVQQSKMTSFIDMHDIGDLLLQQGFSDPVMDMEMLMIYYQQFKQLLQDVRVNNLLHTPVCYPGKQYFLELEQRYSTLAMPDNTLPVTCEIIYGHAWKLNKPAKNNPNEFAIP